MAKENNYSLLSQLYDIETSIFTLSIDNVMSLTPDEYEKFSALRGCFVELVRDVTDRVFHSK